LIYINDSVPYRATALFDRSIGIHGPVPIAEPNEFLVVDEHEPTMPQALEALLPRDLVEAYDPREIRNAYEAFHADWTDHVAPLIQSNRIIALATAPLLGLFSATSYFNKSELLDLARNNPAMQYHLMLREACIELDHAEIYK